MSRLDRSIAVAITATIWAGLFLVVLPDHAALVGHIWLVVVLALFAWLAWNPIATVVLLVAMGGFGFGTVPALQSRVMRYAAQAPTLASGANIGAFNLGNAMGAWLGGVVIDRGPGLSAITWVASTVTVAGLLVAVWSVWLERRAPRVPALAAALPERA